MLRSIEFVGDLDFMMVLIEGALGVMSPQIHGSSVLSLPGIHSVELLQGDGLSSGERFSLGGVGLNWGFHGKEHLLFWDINVLGIEFGVGNGSEWGGSSVHHVDSGGGIVPLLFVGSSDIIGVVFGNHGVVLKLESLLLGSNGS